MGFVGSLFGMDSGNSGGAGLNYNAEKAKLLNPFEQADTSNAQKQAQQGLGMQNNLYGQLAAQNGIQNQSNVFNQQQGLANLYGMQALGYGPNPALAQLAQTTGQNVAQQNALMAGQRGTGSNVGLLARQAAQQGSTIQQDATGQAAILRAQQQLAAQQGLQQQQGLMAGVAGNQVAQQQGALNAYNTGLQGEQGQLLSALGNYNTANVNAQSNVNNANAGISGVAAQQQGALGGGLISGFLGGGSSSMKLARGGMVQHFDEGGMPKPTEFLASQNPAPASPPPPANQAQAVDSHANRYFLEGEFNKPLSQTQAPVQMASQSQNAFQAPQASPVAASNPGAPPSVGAVDTSALASAGSAIGSMGLSNAMDRGQQMIDSASKMVGSAGALAAMNRGGPVRGEQLSSQGKMVPGKAQVKGDSLKNDVVSAKLSPGEIVIPRSIAQAPNAPQKAAEFVSAVLARNGMRRK